MTIPSVQLWPPLKINVNSIFPTVVGDDGEEVFMEIDDWPSNVMFFVGRNGSGKSRAVKAVMNLRSGGRLLSTDRLAGLMSFNSYQWGAAPSAFKGLPTGSDERNAAYNSARESGVGNEELYSLKEQPEVWLKVAAFLRRALGRIIELREVSGYLDPYVRMGSSEYSLLRDEGHGLRELIILLTAAYRQDWSFLVVDEPELHLHPSMARLWLAELSSECQNTGRRAIIVTHEPTLIKPKDTTDLRSVWFFGPGRKPARLSDHILPIQEERVTASLQANPQLVSQLVFSPRPVLVEGVHDVSAFTVATTRTSLPEVVAQTDFVECGGSGGVSLWFEIASKIGLDFKAIADLDACFAPEVKRVMDVSEMVTSGYRDVLAVDPPTTTKAMAQLISSMDTDGIAKDPKSRARWLASEVPTGSGNSVRKEKLLEIWRKAGLWLHPQGTLEDVLGISSKGVVEARIAAQTPGPIDDVVRWAAFSLDLMGDVKILLGAAVERIVHSIMEALLLDPGIEFHTPVGPNAQTDARLVRVEPLGNCCHRVTVIAPQEFAGYWLDFSRDTPSSKLTLRPPENREGSGMGSD